MKSTHSPLVIAAMLGLALLTSRPALAAESSVPRAAIAMQWSGEYRSETISDGTVQGSERFMLTRHPDGSRSLQMRADLRSRGSLFDVYLHVDAGFRPVTAFANYWTGGVLKGAGYFQIEGDALRAMSRGPASGSQTRATAVPARFSIGAHPVSGDGWHTAHYDMAARGVQTLNLYSVDAGADLTKPVLGTLLPLSVEYLGDERVTVPAGTFDAQRFRLAGLNDLWVYGPDRLVVKSELPRRGIRYVLVALAREGETIKESEQQR
ncbi:MAG: hypothetical protein FGM43_07440 [Sinobacteraceae bacterium]|nr:hypothetical protein [Nevskiaceae bacterium]